MPPYCDKHQKHYEMAYTNGMAWKTCICTACEFEKSSGLILLPQAPETTASPNAVAADKGILTEEELKDLLKEVIILKGLKIRSSVDLINSHRTIQERNRNLVFENDEQTADIMMRIRYEGFLRSVIRCKGTLEDSEDYEWFKIRHAEITKTLEETK